LPGTLYVVATPIGNLEDITYRAVRLLGEAAWIACEDTRQSAKLLDHYGIRKPLLSYHDHNEAARTTQLLEKLEEGDSVALITDAGTPLISDPGYRLVEGAVARGIPVVPVPGACAAVTALSAAGLPTDAFLFEGFLPSKATQRRARLEALAGLDCTLVFYESPHRMLAALEDVAAVMPQRPVVAARELTKAHEEILRGTAADVRDQLGRRASVLGEFVLLLGKPAAPASRPDDAELSREVEELIHSGAERMAAIKEVARRHGLSKRDVYQAVENG
jgi:16S rRNA (cytidine1402-2'-O)-methyltransferase